MEIAAGRIVYSKAGRDKGRYFVILSIEGEYVNICDGNLRKLKSPKKKKLKHLRACDAISKTFIEKTKMNDKLTDKDIAHDIEEYKSVQNQA